MVNKEKGDRREKGRGSAKGGRWREGAEPLTWGSRRAWGAGLRVELRGARAERAADPGPSAGRGARVEPLAWCRSPSS